MDSLPSPRARGEVNRKNCVLAARRRPSFASRRTKAPDPIPSDGHRWWDRHPSRSRPAHDSTSSPDEPTGPARSGRPDGRLREIWERSCSLYAAPGFHFVHPGYKRRKAERRQTRISNLRTPAFILSRLRGRTEEGARRASTQTSVRKSAHTKSTRRARLSAFHRGTCGSEPTPPLSSSTRFLGPGRRARSR
jgi:hypothetical protein